MSYCLDVIFEADENKSLGQIVNVCMFWNENVTTDAFKYKHKLLLLVSFKPKMTVIVHKLYGLHCSFLECCLLMDVVFLGYNSFNTLSSFVVWLQRWLLFTFHMDSDLIAVSPLTSAINIYRPKLTSVPTEFSTVDVLLWNGLSESNMMNWVKCKRLWISSELMLEDFL